MSREHELNERNEISPDDCSSNSFSSYLLGVDAVLATFPGSRVRVCRTPEAFEHFWAERTYGHRLRKRAETVAAERLEQLQKQRRQAPVATTEASP
jgi:hypothetical protein